MNRLIFLALVCLLSLSSPPCFAQSAADGYHAVYVMAGYFLRAGNVCTENAKELIDTGFNFVRSNEIKKLSQSFPRTTEEWMTEGSSHFNDQVMKDGLNPTCAAALADSKHAQKAISSPSSGK